MQGFSERVVKVLRRADQRIRSAPRGELTDRFVACRAAVASLASLDAFYVGFFRGESTLVIPYSEDGGRFAGVDVQHYGRGGLSAWLRASGRTYRLGEDSGRLLRKGVPLGDSDQLSQDAVVVPLLDPTNRGVLGMLAFQSWTPAVFDDEVVAAAEWLARALVSSMLRDPDDVETLDLYAVYPDLDSARFTDTDSFLPQLALRLDELRLMLHEATENPSAANDLVDGAYHLCARLQDEVVAGLLTATPDETPSPYAVLTPREREIADLIAHEGLSNAQIATRLVLSEKTVKGHVSGILRKFGVSQRSAIPRSQR